MENKLLKYLIAIFFIFMTSILTAGWLENKKKEIQLQKLELEYKIATNEKSNFRDARH